MLPVQNSYFSVSWDCCKDMSCQVPDSISSTVETTYQKSKEVTDWLIENRGGLAKITGLLMVPAQSIANDKNTSHEIIDSYLPTGLRNARIEKITIPLNENERIEGVICYPKGWNKEDTSRCLLYHNPNGTSVSNFIEGNRLSYTPGEMLELNRCPIILYDYRGVGLNQDAQNDSLLKYRATYESIVKDGEAALAYALNKFENVEVMGSSLGGGVATASLDRHLNKVPLDTRRITRLVNHDSFTTTPRVIFPQYPWLADCVGNIVGGKLDAMLPMGSLIEKGIKVVVLTHTKDPVIPFGARMGDFVLDLPKKDNVKVLTVPRYGHANLSSPMINFLSV